MCKQIYFQVTQFVCTHCCCYKTLSFKKIMIMLNYLQTKYVEWKILVIHFMTQMQEKGLFVLLTSWPCLENWPEKYTLKLSISDECFKYITNVYQESNSWRDDIWFYFIPNVRVGQGKTLFTFCFFCVNQLLNIHK